MKNDGGVVVELEQDMVTIKTAPKLIFPKEGPGAFLNHEFFEASSIRKDGDKYLFVYSSRHNHELCYALSDRPDGGFIYGGTLVSQGDLFMDGRTEEKDGLNYLGNTHGGMLKIGEQWYIFYHRQTNRHSYSRQACAEKLVQNPDGSFKQAEVTSCGLNDGPLKGEGRYEARIACNLWSKDGVGRYDGKSPGKRLADHPYFTQTGRDREENGDQYIANMRDGAVAGFKYFNLGKANEIVVEVRGHAEGIFEVSTDCDFRITAAEIPIDVRGIKVSFRSAFVADERIGPLYFRFRGSGAADFLAFTLKVRKR